MDDGSRRVIAFASPRYPFMRRTRSEIDVLSAAKHASRFLAFAWTLLLVACCEPSGEAVAVSSEPITNAMVDVGDPAVVALVADGLLDCTGTLIAPAVVLTAAHCLSGGGALSAHFGVDARAPDVVIPVTEAHAHPAFNPATLDNDIAILVLEVPADGVTPKSIATADDALRTDETLRVVGFGRSGPVVAGATAGTRRSGHATVSSVSADRVTLVASPSQPCSGDSGGPAFASDATIERVVAVTSEGDTECMSGSVSTRVSAYTSFLAPWLSAPAGGCSSSPSLLRANDGLTLALAAAVAFALLRRKRGHAAG